MIRTSMWSRFIVFLLAFAVIVPSFLPGTANAADRGRPKIVNNNVVGDNGATLRGAPILLQKRSQSSYEWGLDVNNWKLLKDNRMNMGRVVFMDAYHKHKSNSDCAQIGCFTNSEILPILDQMVNHAAAMDMYIVINYHDVGNYNLADMQDFWTKVAPRYKDRTHVIYETSNEPVAWTVDKYTNAVLDDLASVHKNIIRVHAPNTHVIHLTFPFANGNMKEVVDRYTTRANITWSQGKDSVGFHTYGTTSSSNITTLKNAYPVICTEWGYPGAPSVQTMDSKLYHGQVLEQLGISWMDWGADNNYGFRTPRLQRHVNEFQADARSKGYFWNYDYPQTLVLSQLFDGMTTGAAPSGWTTTGSATVVNVPSSSNKSVLLQDSSTSASSSMTRTFTAQSETFDIEYSFMQPSYSNYFRMRLLSGSTQATALITSNGNIAYRDNATNTDVMVQAYNTNTWYNIRMTVKPGTDTFDLYVNNKLMVYDIPFVNNPITSINTIGFNTDGPSIGNTYVDNVKVLYR